MDFLAGGGVGYFVGGNGEVWSLPEVGVGLGLELEKKVRVRDGAREGSMNLCVRLGFGLGDGKGW